MISVAYGLAIVDLLGLLVAIGVVYVDRLRAGRYSGRSKVELEQAHVAFPRLARSVQAHDPSRCLGGSRKHG